MPTSEIYRTVAKGVAAYLASRQCPDGNFPGPDHYGKTFAALLWSQIGEEFTSPTRLALRAWEVDPPRDHGEFNASALLAFPARVAITPLFPLIHFGRRHSANWMLLRAVCRAQPGPWYSPRLAKWEARTALLRYGRKELIYDRPGALSHTYHAFCGALLVDLWQHLHALWARDAAVHAAAALHPHIQADGRALLVGRGKEQIFGYGALLYLLESAAQLSGDETHHHLADRVFHYLIRFRRDDGSFPLVLDDDEPRESWSPQTLLPGWHDYNRYADYLPFLGVYLLKASKASTS